MKNWAKDKLVKSWDTAVLAMGGVAVGVFVVGAIVVGDPGADARNLDALDQPAVEIECLPLDMETGLTSQKSVC